MGLEIDGRVKLKRNTTAYWNAATGFVPLEGEPIIYTDWKDTGRTTQGGTPIYQPGVKIGDGEAYVQDLPFIDEILANQLIEHINDRELHIQPGEREFWNNKLNVMDAAEVIDGALVLNRN